MCGIVGKISFETPVKEEDILKMALAIKHRGPDDGGVFVSSEKKVGLGHRRLSIIDLSPQGHQPMFYKDRYVIVFNGEIYNYQEKRDQLTKEGYQFYSKTDTEVIMALYDRYQEKCLEHLRGMFSFAIYDQKEKKLFCARDRIGKKPFKYYFDGKTFIFASELKAILTQGEYQKEPDFTAIHHYLTLQYCPGTLTGFVGIKKLLPAHYLTLDLKTKKLETKQYWRLDYSEKLSLSEKEWQKRIMEKLEEAVRIRLISDVPLGAFLSGGIDSSAVVGLMSKITNQPVKTFSIGFDHEKFSELKYARKISELFKTDHTEFIVKADAAEILPTLVKFYEEPYADSSALPSYYLSKLTREHVTVALNGDGGDENFAGYSRYSALKASLQLEKLKRVNFVLKPGTRFLSNRVKNTLTERAHRLFKSLDDSYKHRFVNFTSFFTNENKASLYLDSFKEKATGEDTYELISHQFDEAKTKDPLDQALYADFSSYLPEDLMTKVDIATMMVALEGRSPFLDHQLLELTAKIPFNLKIKGFDNKKYILKKALEGFIPNEVMYRKKMGFSIPIEEWFRHELHQYARDILLSKKSLGRGIFSSEKIRETLDCHQNTKINLGNQIWALLTLELWFREYYN